jgi:uncharacterized protein (TIRG00374 family)
MKKLLQPKVLIPLILSIAIIAALLAFSNVQKVLSLMESFQKLYLLYFLLLVAAYEVVRGAQWHFLLKGLDIHVPLRTQIFTFAAGEVTKSMPIGNYFQNYLLQQSQGTDFGFSSAATTLIILIEVAVSLVGVVILGVGSWTGWLRPVIILGVVVVGLVGWAFHRFHRAGRTPKWVREHKAFRKALDELSQFRQGVAALLHPRILGLAITLGALYLVIAGVGLYVVVRGLGIGHIALPQALGVYFFSLAFSLIIPIPIDIGVLEVSGVGAFIAMGLDRNPAVGTMLINRVLSIGASLAIALIVIAVLHDEFRTALQHRDATRRDKPARSVAS